MSLTFCLFYVSEATAGCVAADCKSALFRVTSLVRFQPLTPILLVYTSRRYIGNSTSEANHICEEFVTSESRFNGRAIFNT